MHTDLIFKLREFVEFETRSGSMDSSLITPQYVYRMWGCKIALSEIEAAMRVLNN